MALIYVTGGAKSGKSKFAENLLLGMNNGNQKNIYLATSLVFDEEMKAKVALHKERRQDKWLTVESYKNFSKTLKDIFSDETKNNMLVDCLTNMISNIIFEEHDINWDKPSEKGKIISKEYHGALISYEIEVMNETAGLKRLNAVMISGKKEYEIGEIVRYSINKQDLYEIKS